MKVLLVKPYNISDHIQPSLGLGYLATSIRDEYEVKILDCIKERVKPFDFSKRLDEEKPDVVGIQCYTYDVYNVRDMLKSCKERDITTVIGGPQPSTAPLETMDFFGKELDYSFQGESEIGFKRLLDKLSAKRDIGLDRIPGLIWKRDDKIVLNERCFSDDIDALGMPSWDLIRPDEYPESQHGAFFEKFPIAPVITTRGCPFSCTFCAGNLIAGKRLRKRSVKSIINEITTLYKDYGIREFHIIDDNFTLDRNFAKEFLRRLKESNLNMSWSVPNGVRVDTIDDEMLQLMKETGLYLISLGIESGSDRVLKLMKKSLTTDKVRRAIEMIRGYNIDIAGFFILGFPGETIEDIKETIKFSLELDLIRANYFTYLPFPGTESYNDLKRQGKLDNLNTEKFCFMKSSFTPEGISADALRRFQRGAFMKFFLRPRILFRNLSQIKSFRHFKFLLRRFFNWMFSK